MVCTIGRPDSYTKNRQGQSSNVDKLTLETYPALSNTKPNPDPCLKLPSLFFIGGLYYLLKNLVSVLVASGAHKYRLKLVASNVLVLQTQITSTDLNPTDGWINGHTTIIL